MTERQQLRPIERRVLRLVDAGVDVGEIGQRFRRSTYHIERLIDLARLPGRVPMPQPTGLRPLERCVLGWRAKGASYEEIAPRLARSAGSIERIEGLAQYKLADR